MVEGSQIDWTCHSNDAERAVAEVLDLDRTIQVAFDYADQEAYTLVIITADHEIGGLSLTGGDLGTREIRQNGVTGGTPPVLVFAYEAGARKFAGIYQNSDILTKILALYGFTR
jgi:alkaline phosphatase